MKKSRHSEEKILAVVKQMEGGRKTADVARELGVGAATLYAWKSKYGGMPNNRSGSGTGSRPVAVNGRHSAEKRPTQGFGLPGRGATDINE
jgi:transposase-like protein